MTPRNPVNWFEIAVSDMPRASKFYSEVFQVTLQPMPYGEGEMSMFPNDMMTGLGAGGSLVKDAMRQPGSTGTLVYFYCDDCATEEARIVPNGGQVMMSKMSIGEYGFISVIGDTEGNVIGLHSMQ